MIQREFVYQDDFDCESDDSDYENDTDDENCASFNPHEYENDVEHSFDPEIFNETYFQDLFWNLRSQFPCSYGDLFTSISCAAHGLHLVVTAAIRDSPAMAKLIEKCRALTKKLRTPKLRAELKKSGKKMGMLDVKTRWSSIYYMVS